MTQVVKTVNYHLLSLLFLLNECGKRYFKMNFKTFGKKRKKEGRTWCKEGEIDETLR